MSLQPKPRYTFADYLAAEREAPEGRHEYLAGEVFAMTGASYRHNLIVADIVRALGNRLTDGPCMVLASDMRVRIEAADVCTYPDTLVLCDPPAFHDEREDVLTNPALIVEVLSKSTEGYDRGEKFAHYRALVSLRQYVLVSQDRVGIDLYTREADNRWVLSAYTGLEDSVPLDCIGCTLPLAEVYRRVQPR